MTLYGGLKYVNATSCLKMARKNLKDGDPIWSFAEKKRLLD